MRKIMACLDVGSDTVKLVVGEMVKKKLNILACATEESNGVINGLVDNPNLLLKPIRSVIQKCEEVIGLPIKQVIVSVPANEAVFSVITGTIKINNEGNLITGRDVIKVIKKAIKSQTEEGLEYISVIPTSFSLDENRVVKDPKGLTSKGLSVRGVMVSTPKKNIYPVLACLERLGIDVLDITLSAIGDYFEFKNRDLDKKVTVVINLGDQVTTLSVFNKGVLTNTKTILIGGQNIDNDISFVYKIPKETINKLKEEFALAHTKNASENNCMVVKDDRDRDLSINQKELSKIVMSRMLEILSLSKKEINYLTKKEISYIIFTGGLAEIKDFRLVLDEVFDEKALVGNIMEIGVRDNKYSACLGILKYYNFTARLKDKDYSMFSIEEQQTLSGANYGEQNDSKIGKLFGYIFNG